MDLLTCAYTYTNAQAQIHLHAYRHVCVHAHMCVHTSRSICTHGARPADPWAGTEALPLTLNAVWRGCSQHSPGNQLLLMR